MNIYTRNLHNFTQNNFLVHLYFDLSILIWMFYYNYQSKQYRESLRFNSKLKQWISLTLLASIRAVSLSFASLLQWSITQPIIKRHASASSSSAVRTHTAQTIPLASAATATQDSTATAATACQTVRLQRECCKKSRC